MNIPQVEPFEAYLYGSLVFLVLAINMIGPRRARILDLMVNNHTL